MSQVIRKGSKVFYQAGRGRAKNPGTVADVYEGTATITTAKGGTIKRKVEGLTKAPAGSAARKPAPSDDDDDEPAAPDDEGDEGDEEECHDEGGEG